MSRFFHLQRFTQIPTDALKYNGHYYKIFNEGLSWQEAKVRCKKMGGYLVTITSEKEQAFIDDIIVNGTRGCYWAGGYKDSNNWKWVTGEKFSYTNWGYGEPNNSNDGDENYIMIFQCQPPNAQSQSGEWNDSQNVPFDDGFYGIDNFGFICEWEKNSWKLSGTTATYGTSSKTLATVKGAKSTSGLGTPVDKKITLKNSALSKKVTVSGSYEFDFAAGYKNATISGTAKADTITARGSNLKIFGGKGKDSIKMFGSNQTVSGGAGADTFIYAASGGKEKITDFSSNDTLKIGAEGNGTYSTETSDSYIIVSTDDGGQITLVGAASLSNVNIAGTKQPSGAGVKVSSNGKKITLTSVFEDSSFSLSGKYSSAVTLDASATLLDLNITGNKFSNSIIGSPQDDTIDGGAGADKIFGGDGRDSIFGGKGDDELHGGKGKDTLWGGAGDDEFYGDAGADVFYYKTGEGNDTIYGYEASVDKIVLGKGTISNVTIDRNNNVIFTIGDGQLVVNNAAARTVNIFNSSGKTIVGHYEPQD